MGVLAGLLGLLAFLGGTPGGSTALRLDSTSCHLARSLPGSPLESLSFLGKDAQGLALFHASWDAHRLLQVCSRHDAPELTAAFRVLCAHEAARGAFIHSPGPELQRALATLQSQWDACQGIQESPARAREKRAAGQSGPPGREHLRTKRGWTVPGTLWCGVGNSAGNSSELGIFQGPDLCCREHDRCPQNISPLQYNYGIRNFRFHTISHCDCDTRFKQCLRSQQDSVSDVVGVAFFNVLEIPCFLLEEKEACVAWYWWGGCRKYGSVPIAHIQPRTYYNASWNSPATTPLPGSPSSAPTKLQRKQRPWKRRPQQKESRHPRPATTVASQAPAAPSRPEAGSTAQKGSPQDPRGARRACRSLRQLEQCEHRIGPQETKFQLLNSAPRPLFHCNCTRRLARFLRLHGPPAGAGRLPELLGTTCFKLVPPLDCAEDGGCSRDPRAIKVSARHLLRLQKKHLQLQDRGLNEEQAWPSGPPGTPVSFYSQCLQLARAARGLRGLQDFSS